MSCGLRACETRGFHHGLALVLLSGSVCLVGDSAAYSGEPRPSDVRGTIVPTFQYRLSTWSGPVQMSHAAISYDPAARELFVVDAKSASVSIFGEHGMLTYRFGDDEAFVGTIVAVVPLVDGDLMALTLHNGRRSLLYRCNFRGEPRAEIKLDPAATADFLPTEMETRDGQVYLFDPISTRLVVTDVNGKLLRTLVLAEVLGFDDKQLRDVTISDLAVGPSGELVFPTPTLFTVNVLSPSGELRGFGVPGSAPGRFNVLGGAAVDEAGNIYVTDLLRAVVLVFDPNFNFRGEFGYRGDAPASLVAPMDIVAAHGKVFVSQSGARGVSVFDMQLLEERPNDKPTK